MGRDTSTLCSDSSPQNGRRQIIFGHVSIMLAMIPNPPLMTGSKSDFVVDEWEVGLISMDVDLVLFVLNESMNIETDDNLIFVWF